MRSQNSFPNCMVWRALLIIGVKYKQWDPRIVFSPIDFKIFGKQSVWKMDSTLNKVILIIVVQHQAWWFLSKIFMEPQRLNAGQLSVNIKESYIKQVLQHPCLKLLENKKNLEGRIFHVPNFVLGHNGLIIFSIFLIVYQIDSKGQIIAKEENYQFPRLGVEALGFGIRGVINYIQTLEWNKYLIMYLIK